MNGNRQVGTSRNRRGKTIGIERDERYEATDKTSGRTATERQRLTSLWANVQNIEMKEGGGGRAAAARKQRPKSERALTQGYTGAEEEEEKEQI